MTDRFIVQAALLVGLELLLHYFPLQAVSDKYLINGIPAFVLFRNSKEVLAARACYSHVSHLVPIP